MKNGSLLTRSLFVALLVVALAGCAGSPPVRFYTLTPVGYQEGATFAPVPANPVTVGIAPVEIPDYLDRPQIVTRQGRNELKLAEFDRWAGSLSDNISAVLADNVASLLGSDRVAVNPGTGAGKPEVKVSMRILWWDCVPGQRLRLKAQWTILAGKERKDVAARTETFTESLGDQRYETMVAAFDHILDQVSREIAGEITLRK
jgi:uncharacterized protein